MGEPDKHQPNDLLMIAKCMIWHCSGLCIGTCMDVMPAIYCIIYIGSLKVLCSCSEHYIVMYLQNKVTVSLRSS